MCNWVTVPGGSGVLTDLLLRADLVAVAFLASAGGQCR